MSLDSKNFHLLDIPEGKSGDFWIDHKHCPAGETFDTANQRCALIGGQKNIKVTFQYPTRWHQLHEKESLWMTDLPCEQVQHDRMLSEMYGRVLVGGLGLGYAVTMLDNMVINPPSYTVREHGVTVTVVEKSQDVIDLVWPHISKGFKRTHKVVCSDLFDYLSSYGTNEPYNFGFYDIWASDSQDTFLKMVVPLRYLSEEKVDWVYCWNEDVMRGQQALQLHNLLLLMKIHRDDLPSTFANLVRTPEQIQEIVNTDRYHTWAKPFIDWVLSDPRPTKEEVTEEIPVYVGLYGHKLQFYLWCHRHGVSPDIPEV